MKYKKVLVLEGGFNEEHEVSLATGKEVKKALNYLGLDFKSIIVNPKTFRKDINIFDRDYLCFNALHGTFGEDGQIQKILDKKLFRYTHSSIESSHISFDKGLTKDKIKNTQIDFPQHIEVKYDQLDKNFLKNIFLKIGNFIIKPKSSGSSFGIKVFKSEKDIDFFMKNLKNYFNIYKNYDLLIEEFLDGRELTVAVIEKNKESIPVEVTEIISHNKVFFDYKSKYTPGISKHILPANLKESIYSSCKQYAKIVHDIVGCKGVSRSDFILVNDKIFFLEINSQPGLTTVSLVPEQLKYKNISFNDLIINILECAL